jgi:Fic family protein
VSGDRNGRGTTLAHVRTDLQDMAAYLKKHPEATIRDLEFEFNMTNKQVLGRLKKLGVAKKEPRIWRVKARLQEGPATSEQIARDLGVPLRGVQHDLSKLGWMGEVESRTVWSCR